MLDFFFVATKGGLVLWSKAYGPSQSSPINSLIHDVLIEERSGIQVYYKDNYAIKWTFVNDLDLVFIVSVAFLRSVLHHVNRERQWNSLTFVSTSK